MVVLSAWTVFGGSCDSGFTLNTPSPHHGRNWSRWQARRSARTAAAEEAKRARRAELSLGELAAELVDAASGDLGISTEEKAELDKLGCNNLKVQRPPLRDLFTPQ